MVAVKHRQVWYFHGFDPASTARYRRIFVAASDRIGVAVEDLPDDADSAAEGWRANRGSVTTDVHYCRYEDLVREAQKGSVLARLGRGVRALVGTAIDGAFAPLLRRAPRALALMLTPYWVAFGPLAVVAALGDGGTTSLIVLAAVVAATLLALDRLFLTLVADLFAYMRLLAQGRSAAAEAHQRRVEMLADQIDPDAGDETLLVGHSLGGLAAIHAAEALLARLPAGRTISLLTLGSVHGIVLLQRGAGRDRLAEAIRRLASDERVYWVDVSAPRDAFCLPLLDPLILTGGEAGMRSPRVISARLTHARAIPGDRRTAFGAMRRHMGYLLAPEAGAGFDYADVVTGSLTLEARFRPRGNSPRARMWQR